MTDRTCLDSRNRPIDEERCSICGRSEYNIANPVPLTHLAQIGQSSGCGFFTGFVLTKSFMDSHRLFTIRVSRHDVYKAREIYLKRNNPRIQQVCCHRHDRNKSLREIGAPAYLSSLNLMGFRTINCGVAPSSDPSGYHNRLLEFLGYRRQHIASYGIMFATTSGGGHWAAILKYREYSPGVRTSQTSFLVYDPSTVRSKRANLAWLTASEFSNNYTRNILYIVTRYG